MTHAEAESLGAVEKYLLNELSPVQRDAFEEHYFNCRQCAVDVELLSDTVEVIRKGIAAEAPKPSGGIWRRFERPLAARVSYLCTLALTGVLVYQHAVTLPQLRAELDRPQTVLKLTPNVQRRGVSGQYQSFEMPVRFQPGFASYRVDFKDETGQVLQRQSLTAQQAEATEALIWPNRRGVRGKVQVQIFGLNAGFTPQPLEDVTFYIP
ncbi:MAG: zf-HC2 domain-containing protein [Bryobacterales bacterium]|nr:zf-HC2 domain-containing protein [Bryobacterales bacterium]